VASLLTGEPLRYVTPEKGDHMKTCPVGYREVIVRSIRKNGKIIYPKKSKAFRFFVKIKK
jgi:hypothetical protein